MCDPSLAQRVLELEALLAAQGITISRLKAERKRLERKLRKWGICRCFADASWDQSPKSAK